jgi:hypothetical protein
MLSKRLLSGVITIIVLALLATGSHAADDIGAPFALGGGQRVAANAHDKWVVAGNDHIAVITDDGRVFVHLTDGKTLQAPYQLATDAPVAASTNDHFVFDLGDAMMVVTKDGQVFIHDIRREVPPPSTFGFGKPVGVSVARRISDPTIKVAANPQDKHVLLGPGKILVITDNGSVFSHDFNLSTNKIDAAVQLTPPTIKVAANPQDKHVLSFGGNKILVITDDGSVFAHGLTGNTIGAPSKLSPPDIKVAARPEDKRVLVLANEVLVITQDGGAFGHEMFPSPPPK